MAIEFEQIEENATLFNDTQYFWRNLQYND